MNRQLKKKIWICSDLWMDIFPFFDRPQLGLNLALLSYRYDALVDAHFDDKTTELTLWRTIVIRKDIGPKAKLFVWIDGGKYVEFPFPDRPLPNKIRFRDLWIEYIDHSVIEFLRANKQIWDRKGTKLGLYVYSDKTENDVQTIWDILAREIWPLFATNIRQLYFPFATHFDNFRCRTSPTILTDLDQLISIDTDGLFPDEIADHFDGPNAISSAGQALTKWVHTPSKNGQPKRLFCEDMDEEGNIDWVNSFKETFLRATASVSYKIRLELYDSTPIGPFELENERTKEKLTLEKVSRYSADNEFIRDWLMKRCPISEKAAAVQWENDDKLNKVTFHLWGGDINKSIGPLSPPAEEEKEKADESNEN